MARKQKGNFKTTGIFPTENGTKPKVRNWI